MAAANAPISPATPQLNDLNPPNGDMLSEVAPFFAMGPTEAIFRDVGADRLKMFRNRLGAPNLPPCTFVV